jgi:hypothetical protein
MRAQEVIDTQQEILSLFGAALNICEHSSFPVWASEYLGVEKKALGSLASLQSNKVTAFNSEHRNIRDWYKEDKEKQGSTTSLKDLVWLEEN